MHKLDRGCGNARYEMVGDGTVVASLRRPLVPANAGALSTDLLEVAPDRGACGVLASLRCTLGDLPPIDPQRYKLCAA